MFQKKIILTFVATVILTRVFIYASVRLDPDSTRFRGENIRQQSKQLVLNSCVK